MTEHDLVHSGFLRSAERFPERPALEAAGDSLTYRELYERAAALAATLVHAGPEDGPPLTGVFAYRTPTAFAGVLGSLFAGHGYVPLNRTFPTARSRTMLERAGCRALIVDSKSADQLEQLVEGIEQRLLILLPDRSDVADLAGLLPQHTVLGSEDLEPPDGFDPVSVDPSQLAYVLFTSGSTGAPKGVMVAHENVTAYIQAMLDRYDLSEHDRCSQMFELTFDLSVFDMFVSWSVGARLCCPSEKERMSPARFLNAAELTVWFSAPSTAIVMRGLRMLKPNSYPTLRLSLFCGEALPVGVVNDWSAAAPNSVIDNLYGPTEATVACLAYRWDPARSPAECEHGVVPIGRPLPAMSIMIADQELSEVTPGAEGELLVSGPQVCPGYWKDPDKTAAAFVLPPGQETVHYRTGDRVRHPAHEDGPVTYLGRMDHQIKIRGVRVELGEIEAAIREEAGVDEVVAVGWPVTVSGADAVVAFVGDTTLDVSQLRSRLDARLPTQMVPRKVHLLPRLPLNSNGKFDRNSLVQLLERPS